MAGLQWIAAKGFFSEIAYDTPVWLGVDGDRIAALETSRPDNVAANPIGYLLPLLADTHAHVYMNPWPLEPEKRARPGGGPFEEEVRDALVRMHAALKSGVGFVRDMGDPHGINLAIKDRAPLVLQAPGTAVHRPRKYGRYLGVSRETIDDVLELVDRLAEDPRVDYIKLAATGIVNFKDKCMNQKPQFTAGELRQAVERANHHGLRTAAHCSGDDGVDIALEAGIDFIEHGYFIRPDQIERAAELGRYWTPTFAPVLSQYVHREACGWDDRIARNLDQILSDHRTRFAYAVKVGAPVLAGTDGGSPGVPIGRSLRDELSQMELAGIMPEILLRLASADAADACRPEGYCGRLRVGDRADFAVYQTCPWETTANLETLETVYRGGQPC